ncbi:hypothetical protein ACFCZ1_11565 [Streptomyces sp. NPDC056224]|uniref:hypothetical protein n=1 Tax=Streptomyces sp. NPDC056224 TaxID=3345750 RepID=UPI0035DD6CE9
MASTGRTPDRERELCRPTQSATDEIAAKKLGIGLRTARRMMSEMTGRLGARSRFEAGVLATEAGPIGPIDVVGGRRWIFLSTSTRQPG